MPVEKLRDGFPANEDAATGADSGQLARANVFPHGANAHQEGSASFGEVEQHREFPAPDSFVSRRIGDV